MTAQTRPPLDADPASYVRHLWELRPDNLDVVHMSNEAIEEVRQSAIAAEEAGLIPRADYGHLTPEQIEEGHQAELRR